MAQSSRLQLSLSAKNLKNMSGLFDKSDPFCVVTVRGDNENNIPVIVGETEVVFNSLDPEWATVVILDGYRFGVPCYIEIGVFDFDAKSYGGVKESKLAKRSSVEGVKLSSSDETREMLRKGTLPHPVMGTALFEIGEIMGSRGNIRSKTLQTGGAVYVHLERSVAGGDSSMLEFQLRGLNLPNISTFGKFTKSKINPFFEISRRVERPTGAIWSSVYHSDVVRGQLSPRWDAVSLSLEKLCNGDLRRPMKITVWHHSRSGKHKYIGEVETNMQDLIEAETTISDEQYAFPLKDHDDKPAGSVLVLKATKVDSGGSTVSVAQSQEPGSIHESSRTPSQMKVQEEPPARGSIPPDLPMEIVNAARRPEFVDYISGGCKINLAVAIDFTASNGDPRQEGTPHYVYPKSGMTDSDKWNHYETAIYAVGTILANYDSDQKFPVWGFGAKYGDMVRHCFQCGPEVEVQGVDGIMDAYRGVFSTPLTMSSPTLFTEVITTAASYARHEEDDARESGQLAYTILLILTAGDIENAEETKRLLSEASDAPLSIVIVGIGDSNFERMQFLDDHDPAEGGRDITKIVEFSEYSNFNSLTEAVLDEIPDELVNYYFSKSIMPPEAEKYDIDEVMVAEADGDDRTYTFLG